jgi:hypothetical protein
MKSFKQFLSESVSIAGDFNGNLYINSSEQQPQQVGEEYVADVMWNGSLYRLEQSKNLVNNFKKNILEQSFTKFIL